MLVNSFQTSAAGVIEHLATRWHHFAAVVYNCSLLQSNCNYRLQIACVSLVAGSPQTYNNVYLKMMESLLRLCNHSHPVWVVKQRSCTRGLIKSIIQNHQKMQITVFTSIPQITNWSSRWQLFLMNIFIISTKCWLMIIIILIFNRPDAPGILLR